MINVAIIDDEQLAVENLQYFLKNYDDINIVGGFTDADELYKCLRSNSVQLLFMDIEMPEINGLELASQIIEEFKEIEIVFATAYNQYAVKAFELNAIDYILKPLSQTRIDLTIEKIKKRIPAPKETKIFIKCLGGFEIYVNDTLINFKLSKAKEVLAYLINNGGKSVGWMTIADDVWPDSLDDKKLMNNFHVACFSLRTFLTENGISDIFDYGRNLYRVKTECFKCDFLELVETYQNYRKTREVTTHPDVFQTGEYLENLNYFWSIQMADKVEKMINELEKAVKAKEE